MEIKASKRPLSPHISIYKPIPTMVMSFLHRITGVLLYFGTILVVWWLTAIATGGEYFTMVSGFFSSVIGKVLLFGYSFSLIHHLLGGVRHLVWDTSYAMRKETTTKIAQFTPIISIILTLLIWVMGYILK